ncbi:ATP-binding protein [Undibacterium sp. Xuan67W]|uniref:ATP-binding protein n=1 Tax=Undibacterium sp. Xuan67W TaxID=3413057 RepID=UPI003BF3FB26
MLKYLVGFIKKFKTTQYWSIRQRLLFITLVPVSYLFCMLVWHSYWLHTQEVKNEIEERGNIITKVLAESSEYALASDKLPDLKLSLDGLVQSERGILSIDILDANRKVLLHSQSKENRVSDHRIFDLPIKKRLTWVNVIPSVADPVAQNDNLLPTPKTQLAGYVVVVMSFAELENKQQHRFAIELAVAALGLIISAWLAVHLSRTLSVTLAQFIDACRSIRSGNFSIDLTVKDGGEIGELQTSIKEMADSLQRSTTELGSRVAERTVELETSRNEAIKANMEKRKLIQKIHGIVEEERKSIALEVHDELNASLIAVRLESQRIIDLSQQISPSTGRDKIQQHAQSINKSALDLYNNGRALVRRLRPEVLDMLGLEGAISEMVSSSQNNYPSCDFSYSSEGNFDSLDNASAMSIYRIVQETLSNVIKHANARHVEIILQRDAVTHAVHLLISDDGTGFDQALTTSGLGLIGVRERVFALDGDIQILSETDGGTTITIRLG